MLMRFLNYRKEIMRYFSTVFLIIFLNCTPLAISMEQSPLVEPEWEDISLEEITKEGKQLLEEIYISNPFGPPSHFFPQVARDCSRFKKRVRDLIWLLYSKAVKKNNNFFEGTFVIEDPGYQLFQFLKYGLRLTNDISLASAQCVYKRPSSHFNEYAEDHYGISISDLPLEKKHVLFGKLSNERIYIKPENYGLEGTDIVPHTWEYVVAQIRKSEALRKKLGLSSDTNNEMYRKERIDHDILKQARNFIILYEPNYDTQQEIINTMKLFGLSKIITILENYAKRHTDVQRFVDNLKTRYKDWEIRKGNEVIFTHEELMNQTT